MLIVLLIHFASFFAIGQELTNKEKKALKEAETYLRLEEYHFVEDEMLESTKLSPSIALMWYYLGIATFYSPTKNKVDALPYFEKANELSPDMRQVNYWLGKNYQLSTQFDKAVVAYQKARGELAKLDEDALKEAKKNAGYQNYTIEELDRFIEQSQRGTAFMEQADDKLMLNLSLANTYLPDITPIITVDAQRLYFTSHRQDISSHHELDPHDQLPYQDVFYMDRREDGYWGSPKEFVEINTEEHDAAIALTADGNQLFMYRSVGASTVNPGDIYEVHRKGKKWTSPKPISAPINSSALETHMSMSSDGKVIIFTSNRTDKNAHGGKDLYIVRQLPNGEWAEPQNMGDKINTDLDEESPYIHPDGKVLYFSSQGHHSIGGFDVFKVDIDLKTGELGELEQLNYPVNSPSDDLFYVMSADGSESYFSSVREEGMGGFDIYCVKNNESNVRKVVFFNLKVNTENARKVKAHVKLVNIQTHEVEKDEIVYTDGGQLKFMHRCADDYAILVSAEGYLFKSERINFDLYETPTIEFNEFYELQTFAVNKSEPLNNIYFKDGELDLASSTAELQELKTLVDDHSSYSLEIIGHSNFDDSKSPLVLEFETKTKSMETLEGLKTIGVEDDNLINENIGYGTRFPLYLKDSPDSWKNDRMEYIIRPKGYRKMLSRAANCTIETYDQEYYELDTRNDVEFIERNEGKLSHLLSELKQCAYLELVITADNSKKSLMEINQVFKYMEDNGVEREQLTSNIVSDATTGMNLQYIEDEVAEDGYVNYDPQHDHNEIHEELISGTSKLEVTRTRGGSIAKSNEDLAFESRIEDMTIQFPFNSEEFGHAHDDVLQEIFDYLENNPLKGLKIIGHTDSTGPDVYNTYLGMQRAKSVAYFFKDLSNPNRISVDSKGEDEPIASNSTRNGRSENRRIQFKFQVVSNAK
ncbi:OmpA family protein [Flammeovirga agarivorans]|uniref:OmpA family protein n=1 Tax=Flammeovirga agarivorans TaxID=2726742 RepID=A0A7X8SG89_9BACT|nr:OmpA family protein [Flammeovirga agarivorans]NLR89572.1 OmpA family protein [Flammeovirga agarivorans]